MASPTKIQDRPVYRGDPYELRFLFKNEDETPRDLTTAAWVIELYGDQDWAVDVTDAATGIVRFTLTAAQTACLTAPFVRWDLAESNIWGRTLFTGRLKLDGQV
jgi:hypothetical protein